MIFTRRERCALIVLVLVILASMAAGLLLPGTARAAGYPPQAELYRRDLIRSARYVLGMSAPVAVLAAQVHQESGWNSRARSAYASGLAQFTPATARDMARLFPAELAGAAPLDPRWALLALCRYDARLLELFPHAATLADRWAFCLSAYNGGPGWTIRDRAKAQAQGLDPERWFGSVELVNAGRAPEFKRENTDYPRKILLRWQPLYRSWGPGVNVSEVEP